MIHIPQWLVDRENNKTKDPQYHKRTRFLRTRYLIRCAALISNPEGGLKPLGEKLGLDYAQICKLAANYDSVLPGDIAIKINQLVGEDVIPLSLLRPDLIKSK